VETSNPPNVAPQRRHWVWLLGLVALIPLGLILIRVIAIRNANTLIETVREHANARVQKLQGATVHRPAYYPPQIEGDAWALHKSAIDTLKKDLSSEDFLVIDPLNPEEEGESEKRNRETELARRLESRFKDIRRGLSMNSVRPDFDWTRGIEQDQPALGQLSYFRALAFVARQQRLQGRDSESLELLAAGLAVAQDLSTLGYLIVDLLREASQERLRTEIGALLANHKIPAPILRDFLRILEAVEAQRDKIGDVLERELLCSRVTLLATLDKFGNENWGLNPLPGSYFSNRVLFAEALRELEALGKDIGSLKQTPAGPADEQAWRHWDVRSDSTNPLVGLMVPSLRKAVSGWKRHQLNADLAQCAAAIACHQTDKGRSPSALKDLVPDYLPALPMDPYAAGATFVYRTEGPTAIIYSWGPDKDDGGRAFDAEAGGDPDEGDLVWKVKLRE
jgi:hypothetical protein